jgi:hypothetical protein
LRYCNKLSDARHVIGQLLKKCPMESVDKVSNKLSTTLNSAAFKYSNINNLRDWTECPLDCPITLVDKIPPLYKGDCPIVQRKKLEAMSDSERKKQQNLMTEHRYHLITHQGRSSKVERFARNVQLTLAAIESFKGNKRNGNSAVGCFPVHISGKTQPIAVADGSYVHK